MAIKEVLILAILIISSIQDIRTREVSNLASLFLILISLIDINYGKILAFIIITLPFLIINFKNENSFGAGDVKIIAGICINLGFIKSIEIIAIALFISSLMTIIRNKNSQPFVPYLFIGYFVSLII